MIIPQVFAIVLFFLIPILLYVFTIMIVRYSDENSTRKFRRWFYAARKPLGFKSLSDEDILQVPEEDRTQYLTREIILRLFAVYLVIVVFFLTNIIGSFYTVMADVVQEVGNTGSIEVRTWSAIVMTTPFSGGWSGTFPWYGYGLWPPAYLEVYHEPWNWVFHTSALTDNPDFFSSMAVDIIFVPVIVGAILLIPLARRSVREAFLPSILHLHVSMMIMMSSIFNCFAEAFKLVILSYSITYGQYTIDATDLNGLPSTILLTLIPVLLVMFVLFVGISYSLARTQYSTSVKGKRIFVANTALLFLISLVLAILV